MMNARLNVGKQDFTRSFIVVVFLIRAAAATCTIFIFRDWICKPDHRPNIDDEEKRSSRKCEMCKLISRVRALLSREHMADSTQLPCTLVNKFFRETLASEAADADAISIDQLDLLRKAVYAESLPLPHIFLHSKSDRELT